MQEKYDLDVPLDSRAQKLIDAAGAGRSTMSPGWLTELGRLWGGKSVRCLENSEGSRSGVLEELTLSAMLTDPCSSTLSDTLSDSQ